MNVEDWEAAALHEIVARIVEEASARGVEVIGSELVGLMPAGAAAAAAGAMLRIDGFDASRVLELRLLDGADDERGASAADPDERQRDRCAGEHRLRREHGEERRDKQQAGRVRAAVDERDQPEHPAERRVGDAPPAPPR